MENDNSEWEDQIKEKPFSDNHFTPQMIRHVESHLKTQKPSFKRWMILAVLPVLAGILFIVNNEQDSASAQTEMITFSGTNGEEVQLPLQITKADLSVDDGTGKIHTEISRPTVVNYTIPPEMKDKLQAVLVYRSDMASAYLLLAPIGWEASAIVGANGSYGVTLTDPSNKEQTLVYSDTAGSCQGCAINSIGTYFPDKAEWADEQGFTVYDPLSFIEWSQPGTNGEDIRTAVYKTNAEEGYFNQGVVYYEQDAEEQWYLFRRLELKMTEEKSIPDNRLDMVMDFFVAHHGVLIIPASI